jgi:hypothetical protein
MNSVERLPAALLICPGGIADELGQGFAGL